MSATPFVLNATQILVGNTDKQVFQNATTVAFGTGTAQIDDVIGFTSGKSNTMYHWVQWSTKSTPATGNVLNLWVSYQGWDALTNYTVSSQLNIMGTYTWTSATAATAVTSRSAGPQSLGVQSSVTAANNKGNYNASSNTNIFSAIGNWTTFSATTLGNARLSITRDFNADPVIKVGQSVNYLTGWKLFASATVTTTITQGESMWQVWLVSDSAVTLTLSGVAAAITALAF